MMNENFDDLLLLGEADNLGRRPQNLEGFQNVLKTYADFMKMLPTKKFFTGKDIMERYPDIEGTEIGERLEQFNNQVLARDES